MRTSKVQRYKEPALVQLRAFCECVRRKSFSAAARFLNHSHAAVWEQVHALERKLGVSLLQRHGRQLQPTEDGQLLLELADSLVAAMDSLEQVFADRRQACRALTVVGTHTVITEELAWPIVEFCQEHPTIHLTILNYVNMSILDSVIEGDVDLAVLHFDPLGPSAGPLIAEPLSVRPAVLVLPPGHALVRKRRLTLADLIRYPLILPPPSDSPWRQEVDEVFRRAGLLNRLRVLLSVTFLQAARRYVSRGLGIALIPFPADAVEFPGICIRPLGDLFPAEQVVMLWRRGAQPRPQARLFADYVRTRLQPGTARRP